MLDPPFLLLLPLFFFASCWPGWDSAWRLRRTRRAAVQGPPFFFFPFLLFFFRFAKWKFTVESTRTVRRPRGQRQQPFFPLFPPPLSGAPRDSSHSNGFGSFLVGNRQRPPLFFFPSFPPPFAPGRRNSLRTGAFWLTWTFLFLFSPFFLGSPVMIRYRITATTKNVFFLFFPPPFLPFFPCCRTLSTVIGRGAKTTFGSVAKQPFFLSFFFPPFFPPGAPRDTKWMERVGGGSFFPLSFLLFGHRSFMKTLKDALPPPLPRTADDLARRRPPKTGPSKIFFFFFPSRLKQKSERRRGPGSTSPFFPFLFFSPFSPLPLTDPAGRRKPGGGKTFFFPFFLFFPFTVPAQVQGIRSLFSSFFFFPFPGSSPSAGLTARRWDGKPSRAGGSPFSSLSLYVGQNVHGAFPVDAPLSFFFFFLSPFFPGTCPRCGTCNGAKLPLHPARPFFFFFPPPFPPSRPDGPGTPRNFPFFFFPPPFPPFFASRPDSQEE